MYKNNIVSAGNPSFTLTLTGLAAGVTYDWTSWHANTSKSGTGNANERAIIDVAVVGGSSMTFQQATQTQTIALGYGTSSFSFTGGAPVAITFGEHNPSPANSTEVYFNGFEIAATGGGSTPGTLIYGK